MFIQLADGFYYDPDNCVVVRETGRKECALFPPGASATDGGFTLDRPAKEVAAACNEYFAGNWDDESEEPEED